ncbi:eae-like domain protein [Escherichia coli]|uniref:eae-like domain protein n=1 Tax=Escherichia coli TaxID=562 RepID=UPI0017888263|nr:eae-like domain protein [Escherichia coli]MBE1064451.1 eae-like domain protein [Escherichia coli]
MDGNIKWLVSAGHEMASELKAECGAVDMRSVAKLISDLATQLEVQLVRANALAEDQQKAIESIKQADAAVKLAHEKFSALAAENAGLKAICDDRRRFIMNGVQVGYIKVPAAETDPDLETIRIAISPQKPIPATDAFLAEVRAQGVEMYADNLDNVAGDAERGGFDYAVKFLRSEASSVRLFADQLRKGGDQWVNQNARFMATR